jgi:hypothetical protein
MKYRPILFSGEMVRAILEGRKTQTRRPVKNGHVGRMMMGDQKIWPYKIENSCNVPMLCPYGQPGDLLWVRETFALESNYGYGSDYLPPFNDSRPVKWEYNEDEGKFWTQCYYRATDPEPSLCCEEDDCKQCEENGEGPHWRPSIHMPRWASRITLEITNVRVERLREISEEDAEAEGSLLGGTNDQNGDERNYVEGFMNIWEEINGPGAWKKNPWVWVIEFKKYEPSR